MINQQQTQKIQQMVSDGFAARKISRDLKIDFKEVQDEINKKNYQPSKEIFSEDEIGKIVELYKQGVSAKALGKKYNIDKRRVQKWADAEGLLRDVSQSLRFRKVNENAFDFINNEHTAYWLGFLYADGYNSEDGGSVNLALKGSDHGHVKKYVNFLDGDEDDMSYSSITDKATGKTYSSCSYKVNSHHMSKRLKDLGCPQAKSLILTFPEWLDPKLYNHFIRGYFDGDGSIKVSKNKEWRINICGTKEVVSSIKEICKSINVNSTLTNISNTGKNTWIIVISGNEQVKRFCDWMYQNSTVYLDRKNDRYLLLCEQQQNRKFNLNLKRSGYLLSTEDKGSIIKDLQSGSVTKKQIAEKHKVSYRKILVLSQESLKKINKK